MFAIFFQNFWLSLAWITAGLVGINAARSVFWVIPTRFLTGIAAAGGLAFINAVGTAGGFLGPSIMGWLKDLTGSFNAGLVAMAGFLILATALTGALKLFVREERSRGKCTKAQNEFQKAQKLVFLCFFVIFLVPLLVRSALSAFGFDKLRRVNTADSRYIYTCRR